MKNQNDPTPQTSLSGSKECECFGDSCLHASTYVPVGSDREHCDLCGHPVPQDSVDTLTAINSGPAPTTSTKAGWENEEKLTVEQAWTILCEMPDITSPEEYPDHALITMEQLGSYMTRAIPVGTVACPCTTFEQDEDCTVGFPSLLCSACDGKGVVTIDQVVALAAEMLKVAEQVDELKDPFAAWESIELLKSQRSTMINALHSAEIKLARYMEVHGKDGTYIGGLAAEYDASLVVVRAALSATATEGK